MLAKIVDTLQRDGAKLAFCINNQAYSYAELAAYVAGIRALLRRERPNGHFIGVLSHNAIETYASIIAIWLEGYAFVPLSAKSPADRNRNILEQVKAECLLTSKALSNDLTEGYWTVLVTKDLRYENDTLAFSNRAEDEIICMLFTSGSTGLPKGVPYILKNVNSTLDAFFALDYQLTAEDRFLQMFDLTFDMSLLSYLPAWCIGASVFTVGSEGMKYLQAYKIMMEEQITFAAMVPSTLRLLQPYFAQIQLPALRYALFGGEPFYIDLAMDWLSCVPNARVINISGPCETTMACVGYELNRDRAANKVHREVLAFGRAWKNTTTVIVDEQLNVLGPNEEGELCFAGEHVMAGYWQLPIKNESIFFNLMIDGKEHRFYRSGDMAFRDEDGDLYSCGRKDHQYKIQGYKVELGEIEHLATQYMEGLPAIAVVEKQEKGGWGIYLFLEGESVDIESVSVFLKQKLPNYMLPKKIVAMKVFPRTLSGKVDRKRLLMS